MTTARTKAATTSASFGTRILTQCIPGLVSGGSAECKRYAREWGLKTRGLRSTLDMDGGKFYQGWERLADQAAWPALGPNRHFASPQGPPIMPADSMALASLNPSLPVCRERVVSVQRQEEHFACVFANQTKLLLHRFLAKSVAIGDEITFPIPAPDAGAPKFSSTRMPPPGRAVISTRRQSDTSASPSRTNEISTSFLPRFNGEASASARFSCLARFCASTSIASRLRPTKSIIPLCTRSCVSQPALRPLNFAWLSSCAIWN